MSEHIQHHLSVILPGARIGAEAWRAPEVRRDDTIERGVSPEITRQLDERFGRLPVGFGVIGGAARQIAMEQLTGRKLSLRDEDIAAFEDMADAETLANSTLMADLSETYMPDDYRFGHGVGRSASMAEYMGSRDFTVNQLAVVRTEGGWKLHMSEQALLDLPRGTIRPTTAVHSADWYLHDKLAIKAVLLETVLRELDGVETASIKGIDMRRYAKEHGANDFHIALGMQKACEWGESVPSVFAKQLTHYGFISQSRPAALMRRVAETTDFEFRGPAAEYMTRRPDERARRPYRALSYTIGEAIRERQGV